MLKPHLLLTILIFALVGGLAAHFANQGGWHLPTSTYDGGTGTATHPRTGTDDRNPYDAGREDTESGGSYSNSGERNVPGQFDYYALVLSWSPTYCAEAGQDDAMQCNPNNGRRYAFVLHGLWPQYERGYPSECRLARRPFVPQPVIDTMLDIMPSKRLVIHEYRAHGTCSGLDPVNYFATAHRLFDGIKIPEKFRNPAQVQWVSPSDIRDSFLRANPAFDANMIGVVCGNERLKEVRFCVSKVGKPRACGTNENQRKLCSADRISIPPTRSAGRGDDADSQTIDRSDDSLPGPRGDFGRRAQ
jgi:ribonuclease T2